MSVAKTLLKAADYIEKHGWCQGKWRNDAGEVCAYGAISSVERCGLVRSGAAWRLGRFLNVVSVAGWNDQPDRTKEEVIAALRAAAEAQCEDIYRSHVCGTGQHVCRVRYFAD